MERKNVVLLGGGNVATELAKLIYRDPVLELSAVVNSKGYTYIPPAELNDGTSLSDAISALESFQKFRHGETTLGFLDNEFADSRWRGSKIVVDATSGPDEARDWYRTLLIEKDVPIVSIAKTGPAGIDYDVFQEALGRRGLRFRESLETTVMAGNGIVQNINRILLGRGSIDSIEGIVTGTGAQLCQALQNNEPFGNTVRRLYANGDTEPDPRIDIGPGRKIDSAMKAVILARLMGIGASLGDVQAQKWFVDNDGLKDLTIEEYLRKIDQLDDGFRMMFEEAKESGQIILPIISVTRNAVSIALQKIAPDHFLAQHPDFNAYSMKTSCGPMGGFARGSGPTTAPNAFASLKKVSGLA